MKIQINPIPTSQSKRREENCTGRYSKGLRDQNEEQLVNICESNILETLVNQLELYSY